MPPKAEGNEELAMRNFIRGLVTGVIVSLIVYGLIFAVWLKRQKAKELVEYVERQIEIEALREDYGNRDPVEFLDAIPGVRGAVDGATAEFDRKRDEALQRFRSGYVDRRDFRCSVCGN